jgi:hypothetical protein
VIPPVLLVGTGRCGSTLLSELLRMHPTALSISELFSFLTDLGMRIAQAFPEGPISAEDYLALLTTAQPRQRLLLQHGLQMPEVIYPWSRGRFTPDDLPPLQQALLPHLDDQDPDALYDALCAALRRRPPATVADHHRAMFTWLQERFGRRTWVERSGGSLRIVHRLLAAFPEARVLHLVRDGRNTALSMSRHIGFRMAIIAGQQAELLGVDPFESDDRTEEGDLLDELADLLPERFTRAAFDRFDLSPVVCAHYWSGEVAHGVTQLRELPAERLLTMRYEDLLEAPAEAVRRLGGFVDAEGSTEAWVTAAAARVGVGRSDWQALPPRLRDELEEACRPGFEALAEIGLRWS